MKRGSSPVEALVASLDDSADNEIEAERIARKLLGLGAPGIDALVEVLRESSGNQPKLAVAVLNAVRDAKSPSIAGKFSKLLDKEGLAADDRAYLLAILGDRKRVGDDTRRRLLRELAKTKDLVDRSEVLARVVRLGMQEARETLGKLANEIPPERLDYRRQPELAMREEMVMFALSALEGDYEKLEGIAFDSRNHPSRRTASLEFLCLAMGNRGEGILRRAIRDPSREVRGVAVGLVGELGLVSATDVVEQAIRDRDAWVVSKALHALRDLASSPTFLADQDAARRIHSLVLELLREKGLSDDRTDRQILVPALRRASSLLENLLRST